MKRALLIGMLASATALFVGPSAFAFTSKQKFQLTAVATTAGQNAIVISADSLPEQAFPGKNVVIPVSVAMESGGAVQTQNLKVEILYQLLDTQGQPMSGVGIEPVVLQKDAKDPNALRGVAIIPRDNIAGISRGGRLHYFFRARDTSGDTVLERSGVRRVSAASGNSGVPNDPFRTNVINLTTADVTGDETQVSVPDTFVRDGKTTVAFAAGALSGPAKLTIRQDDPAAYPTGPKGMRPDLVYTFLLNGAELKRPAQVTLSYAADLDGKLTGSRANPTDLALYYYDRMGWRLLSRPQIDTTLHTVSATAPHFTTFALFAAGPVSAKDLRPRERIITPNGDGVNDTATFSGLTENEEVKIFNVRGSRVRSLHGPSAVWDGKDDEGDAVESGVYLYQYNSQGERVSGVIVVAK